MLNPKATNFSNPMEAKLFKFQSGKITDKNELLEFIAFCDDEQNKIDITKLTRPMTTPVLNTMAQRLYDLEAEKNSGQPLRSDGFTRRFARQQFERLLGNDIKAFLDQIIPLMTKSEVPTETQPKLETISTTQSKPELSSELPKPVSSPIIIPVVNYSHLKEMLPTLNNLVKCAINCSEDKDEQKQLKEIMNKITNGHPKEDEVGLLMSQRSKLIEKIENIHKKAISELITFNIIKPYVIKALGDNIPLETSKTALKKIIQLDGALVTQLYSDHRNLLNQAKNETKKEEVKPLKPPTPEGPARQSLRK